MVAFHHAKPRVYADSMYEDRVRAGSSVRRYADRVRTRARRNVRMRTVLQYIAVQCRQYIRRQRDVRRHEVEKGSTLPYLPLRGGAVVGGGGCRKWRVGCVLVL